MTPPVRLSGCTCFHAAGLHTSKDWTDSTADGTVTRRRPLGCRVGWSGAGTPVANAIDARHWPSGCPCTAVPVPLGHVATIGAA